MNLVMQLKRFYIGQTSSDVFNYS